MEWPPGGVVGHSNKTYVGGAARTGCTDLHSVRGLSGSLVELILE